MDQPPGTLAELIKNPHKVRDAFAFIESLRRLRVVTDAGEIKLQTQKDAANTVLDLRGITETPTVEQPSPGFTNLQRIATQAIAHASNVAIEFDTAISNVDELWNSGTPTRITFPRAGLYAVYGLVYFDIQSTGLRLGFVRKNGTTIIAINGTQAVTTQATYCSAAGFDHFEAGDYIELIAQQWSGGGLNTLGATFKSMRVGDAPGSTSSSGGGDFSTDTRVSVDGEVVLFNGAGGKVGRRATGTGLAKLTSGVLGVAAAGSDYVEPGAIDTSGLTTAPGKLLGRTSAGTGAIEAITVGSGLSLSGGTLSATGAAAALTHAEPLCANGEIVFAGGDAVVVNGIPN